MKKVLLLLSICLLLLGCNKTEIRQGCTDPGALNYNINANNDNGSCKYPTSLFVDFRSHYFANKQIKVIGEHTNRVAITDQNGDTYLANLYPEEVTICANHVIEIDIFPDDTIPGPYDYQYMTIKRIVNLNSNSSDTIIIN
ncbi:MAG: hypothetical protein MRY83_21180 [Flavobacteriales bacterium]|nr:hypothetical protein [Flavobacteriales bacterium]